MKERKVVWCGDWRGCGLCHAPSGGAGFPPKRLRCLREWSGVSSVIRWDRSAAPIIPVSQAYSAWGNREERGIAAASGTKQRHSVW